MVKHSALILIYNEDLLARSYSVAGNPRNKMSRPIKYILGKPKDW